MVMAAKQDHAELKELYEQELDEMNASSAMAQGKDESERPMWYDVKGLVAGPAFDHHREAMEMMKKSMLHAAEVHRLRHDRIEVMLDKFINDVRQDAWEKAQERAATEAKEAESAATQGTQAQSEEAERGVHKEYEMQVAILNERLSEKESQNCALQARIQEML